VSACGAGVEEVGCVCWTGGEEGAGSGDDAVEGLDEESVGEVCVCEGLCNLFMMRGELFDIDYHMASWWEDRRLQD
jgi:hypothetical protein